jgi:4-hydroxy-3-polyprenylbenzoate decarboxylase
MSYKSLTHFIKILESEGELVRVREYVSPRLEITEVADRMVKSGGKAILFENTGTDFPLLINAFASDRRICLALGVGHLDDIGKDISRLLKEFLGPKTTFLEKLRVLPTLQEISSWMPRLVSGRGVCQEVVMDPPDLTKLPVLTCWPADGGPFITLPSVHTRDPETGMKNVGMYRMQVFGPELTGMHWHLHKGSAHHFNRYKALGRRMPVSVTLGGDPAYTYAATAPLPENLDEYLLAGFLRKKKVDLVKCLTNDLEVPADADFVIEGYVDPAEELILEGPFGDHTGFYSLADYFPRVHVTCITHRREAVYPATIVGIPPQEDGWIGKATEKIFLTPIRLSVAPEVEDMHMPVEGVFHNITLVSIRKAYPGQALKIMSALWGAGQMMFNKIMAVTDHDIPLTDYMQLARTISERTDPIHDVQFIRGPVDILDHSSRQYAYGSKLGLDATRKVSHEGPEPAKPGPPFFDTEAVRRIIPAIREINASLLAQGISLVIMSFDKSDAGLRPGLIRPVLAELLAEVISKGLLRNVRFILITDPVVDVTCLPDVTWIAANNIDPMRDCFYIESEPGVKFPCLFADATAKQPGRDGFNRDWPNIIVMDDEVIREVDRRWDSFRIGPRIDSPSLKYKSQVISAGAVSR